jgi:hypothetical protein
MMKADMEGFGRRLREFEEPEPEMVTDDPAADEPVAGVPEIDRISEILERETGYLKTGDFDRFQRLQSEKRAAMRAVERLQRNGRGEGHGRAAWQASVERFERATRRNEQLLGALREASTRIKRYAIEAIENSAGDGLYRKGGEARAGTLPSVNGIQVKL